MMLNKPYIICAAVHVADGFKKREHLPKNIHSGLVVCGRSHHNCFTIIFEMRPDYRQQGFTITQGFITSDDHFVNRKQAATIAYNAGQIAEDKGCLVSEDLY